MARSLAERVLPQTRHTSRTLVRPIWQEQRLWPPLVLLFLLLLTLVMVYRVRPTIFIDLGGRYDSAYLRNFHDREVDMAGVGETLPWPTDRITLDIPGRRMGDWMATVYVADGQPVDALIETALAANDLRVRMARWGPANQFFVALIPANIMAQDQVTLRLVPSLEGNPDPVPGLVGQIELTPARTYRWTRAESAVSLPGLGRGTWQVDLTVVTQHPDGQPLQARVYANETLLAQLPEDGSTRRISLLIPSTLMRGGDLELTLRSNTFADPRPLGMFVSNVVVAPTSTRDGWLLLPPWGTLFASLILTMALYACLLLLLPASMSSRQPPWWATLQPWVPILAPITLIMLGGWALTVHRYPTSFMLPRLAWLALWSLVLLLIVRPLLLWAFRAAGVPTAARGAASMLPVSGMTKRGEHLFSRLLAPFSIFASWPFFINALLLAFFVSYWFKVGGMLYPYFVSIDVNWHMDKVRWIFQGLLPLMYGINNPLNELTMPVAEWGTEKPVIPYSPYFHMFATSFALLPWPLAFTANMFSALVDCSRVFIIALLARKSGLSERGALLAAVLYAVLPVTFLLHSWGNMPTTFGLWWTLLAIAFTIIAWRRLHRPGPFALLTFFTLGSLLFYTVTGVFTGFFVLLFIPILWLVTRRNPARKEVLVGLRPFTLASIAALLLSLLIYYGQYIMPIINQTIPYMLNLAKYGPESVGVERAPFGEYMLSYIPHLDYRMWPNDYLYYGLMIPLLFVLPGFLAFRQRPVVWSALAAWFTVSLIFMVAGYRISMVDKQLFFIIPAICMCWAIYAERYWRRGRWGQLLIITIYLFTLVSALDLWVLRIIRSPMT